jgi:hypothetical protein
MSSTALRLTARESTALAHSVLVGALRFGPSYMPSRDSPEEAIELLLERGYSAVLSEDVAP